jgi:hypothetical protein
MNSNHRTAGAGHRLVVAGAALLAMAFAASAQVKTKTENAPLPATQSVKVERGEVAYVYGNDLVVKMEDGELRHFSNVPLDKTVTVDGKELTVRDLKPGMKLERTTVTTSAPKMVTTVKTVTGRVLRVSPPYSVILTLEDGTNQSFKIPKGQKFTVEGKEMDSFGLKKGMKISATAITESTETVVSNEVKRTGTLPPAPPEAPKADTPLLIVVMRPVPAPAPVESAAAPESAPTKLPKTATFLPLIGLLGALSTTLGLGLKALRTYKS